MDVLDLDWSPSGLLASASIDNTICLWNVNAAWSSTQKVLSPFRQLQKHTSFVKGVQFDPFGIYLASASADNTVIIWNCESWSVEHILTEPLRASIDRSMFRRLSWAPDGGSLCISCATKGGKNVGMVLKRDTWISVADLVGHNVQTTCCRFNPHSLRISTTDNTFNTACTVALGDQQGVISVWTTNQNSPLFVIKNIFDGPILDIAWYAQTDYSLILGACSLDGSIIVLSTSEMNATGGDRLLLPEERELHLKSIYGRGDKELSNAAPTLPLDPAVIRFSNTMSNGSHPIPSEQRIPDATMMPKSCLGSNFQQTVTRLKNGKKRIQPILSDVAPSDRDRIPVKSVPNSLPNRHFVEPALVHQHSFLCRLNFKQNSASFFAESSSASSIVKNNSSKGSGVAGGISFLENHNADSWLYLTASELIPPRPLDPVVSVVVLTRSSRSIDPSRSHHVLWETYIAGEVTSICGLDISVGTNPTGMAVVGTSLGTLVLLCLSSGIRLSSPMILGGSVIFVDLVYLNDSSTLRIVALNSTGEIWLFHYSKSCFTNTPMKFQLNLFRKTSLEPLRPFVGTNRDAELLVESCELCDRGEFIISLKSSKVMLNRGSLHFKYLHELQCWIQVGHLRSFLSRSWIFLKFLFDLLSSDENCLVNDPTYTLPEIIAHSYPIPSNGSENHYFGKLILSEIEVLRFTI